MNTNNKFEQELIDGPAYKNPEGKRVIDEAIARMHAAEAAGNAGEVERITLELAEKLTKIAAMPKVNVDPPENLEQLKKDLMRQFPIRKDQFRAFWIIGGAYPKIKGIDGKNHSLPSRKQVEAGLTPEKLRLISKLENPILLLVPDGKSLKDFLDEATKKNKNPPKLNLPPVGAKDIDFDSDKSGTLIFGASLYDKTNHGGQTKAERLAEPGAIGWQVFAVDGGNEVPVDTVGKSADDLLAQFRAEGFGGLSAEAYIALQMHGQVAGIEFDDQYRNWLLESYLPNSGDHGEVLTGCWDVTYVLFDKCAPNISGGEPGARRSVRIL